MQATRSVRRGAGYRRVARERGAGVSVGFVHLRLHTEYSLTDGVVRVEPPKRKGGGVGATLTSRADELQMPAVAITDQNNLFAVVEFYKSAESPGIKPTIRVDGCFAPVDQKSVG